MGVFLAAFFVFFGCLLFLLSQGISITYALLTGIAAFTIAGVIRGVPLKKILIAAYLEMKKMFLLLAIFLLIGTLTGLWRSSGTIATCIFYSGKLISPRLFYGTVFLITSAIAYMLGTSFGVTGTAGVIFMALGRASGAYLPLLAGTIVAAAYFGDRCSPASSSASLVAAVTQTDLYQNVKNMHKTGWIPFALSTAIYFVLGIFFPTKTIDESLLDSLTSIFSMGLITLLPALLMVLLPIFKVPIKVSIGTSAAAAFCVSIFYQKTSFLETVEIAIMGYSCEDPVLGDILSGGGMISMVVATIMVFCTGALAGVLNCIGVLEPIRAITNKISLRIGKFPACCCINLLAASIFCNQSVCAVVSEDILEGVYGENREELAIDLENSGVVIAPLLPWNIAVSVPLTMIGADAQACLFEFLLVLIPITYLLLKPVYFKEETK